MLALVALALTGTVAYALLEGWSLLDALYATIITITTVGYGDLSPQTPRGRLFAIFFTLIAIGIGGYLISNLAAFAIDRRTRTVTLRYRKQMMERINALKGHYILCGADLLGTRIAEEFTLQGAAYVVIDNDEVRLKTTLLYSHPGYLQQKLKTLVDFHEVDLSAFENQSLEQISERLNIPYLLADPTDDAALMQAGIERAAGLIAACPDDRDNLSIVIGARSLARRGGNEALRIMTRADEPRNMRKLYLAGADFVRIPSIMGGMEMAAHMLHPEIGNWWYSRVGEDRAGQTENRGVFQQVNLSERPAWVGQTAGKIHENERMLIVSVKRDGKFISPPPVDFRLQPDDIAIVIG